MRVRASNLFTLLIGIIKPYHYYYWYFLLRSLVGEIFAGPFHQAEVVSSSFTVFCSFSSKTDSFSQGGREGGPMGAQALPSFGTTKGSVF